VKTASVLWAVFKGVFHYSGLEFISRKFIPKDKFQLPTGFIWLIGFYIALFGVASQRYENRVDVIENRANAIFTQLATPIWPQALGRIPKVQNMPWPYKPDLHNPLSVIQSLFYEDVFYTEMVSHLKEAIETWKKSLEQITLVRADLRGADLSVADLRGAKNLTIEQLVLDKYHLKKAAEKKINHYRQDTRNKVFQSLMFGDMAEVTVTPDICFSYSADPRKYVYSKAYQGRSTFNKHYYPEIGDLEAQGEEFECAQFIDQLDEIEFWVRNPVRRPGHSFWLQTSTDKFYPDFVCKLKDGRVLVIEYKGGHLWNDETKEKKDLGELWAKRSGGACLFVMPTEKDYVAISKVIASR